jgi:3,4-dihydroxy 2-butanone 4-phosphate synthase / GTP cyclohydrolase II
MKLADWLIRNGVKRSDFARRIGVSPGAITQICRDAGAWVSRDGRANSRPDPRRRHAQ